MKSLADTLLVVDSTESSGEIYEAGSRALYCRESQPVAFATIRSPAKRVGVPVLKWKNNKVADGCLVQMLFRASQPNPTLWEHLLDEDHGWQGPVPEDFTTALCHPTSTPALATRLTALGSKELRVIRSRLVPKSQALLLMDPEMTGVSPKNSTGRRGFLVFSSGILRLNLH